MGQAHKFEIPDGGGLSGKLSPNWTDINPTMAPQPNQISELSASFSFIFFFFRQLKLHNTTKFSGLSQLNYNEQRAREKGKYRIKKKYRLWIAFKINKF
jgi:hypothetical protein